MSPTVRTKKKALSDLITIAGAVIVQGAGAIDVHGHPEAYHPDDIGLDFLYRSNALKNFVQRSYHPSPGYLVSPTVWQDLAIPRGNPDRYLHSGEIPYMALPYSSKHWAIGDVGLIMDTNDCSYTLAVLGDWWPTVGAMSMRAAELLNLGVDGPRVQPIDHGILYVVFSSGRENPWCPAEDWWADAERRLKAWGGLERLVLVIDELFMEGYDRENIGRDA